MASYTDTADDSEGTLNRQSSEINSESENTCHTENSKNDKQKIDILLKAAGDAPIMKKKKWSVDAEKQIGWISDFIKKYLKLDPPDQLFLYVNQTFAPSPDQIVRNLYDCYGSDGRLVLHYCKSQAWG